MSDYEYQLAQIIALWTGTTTKTVLAFYKAQREREAARQGDSGPQARADHGPPDEH